MRRNRINLRQQSQVRRLKREMKEVQKTVPVYLRGSSPFWFRIVEVIGIVIALAALLYTIVSVRLAQVSLHEESIARAWAILAAPSSGNSGKVRALNTLRNNNIPMEGIDLSCKRMGGGWDEEKKFCTRRTYLRNVQLQTLPHSINDLKTSKLTVESPKRWTEFTDVNLDGFHLNDVVDYKEIHGDKFTEEEYTENLNYAYEIKNFDEYNHPDRVRLAYANLSGADLQYSNLARIILTEANLTGAILDYANLFHANLLRANLTASDIIGTDLKYALIWNGEFFNAFIKKADFSHSSLYKSRFKAVQIKDSLFRSAFIQDANFTNAYLTNVDFSNADLRNSIFTNALLDDVKFCDPKIGCAHYLTAKQIQSAWSYKDTWDPLSLPQYLKNQDGTWPTPKLCDRKTIEFDNYNQVPIKCK